MDSSSTRYEKPEIESTEPSSTRDVGATLERAAELQALAVAYCRIAQLDEALVRKTVFGYAPLPRGRAWRFWPDHARRRDGSAAHECLIDPRIGGNGRTADDVKRDWFAALARLDAYECGLSSGGSAPERTGLGLSLERLGIAMTADGKTSTVEGGWFEAAIANDVTALPGLQEVPEPPPKKTRAKPVRLTCGKCGWEERVSQRHMQRITGHQCRGCGAPVANDQEPKSEAAVSCDGSDANGCSTEVDVPEMHNQLSVSESCTQGTAPSAPSLETDDVTTFVSLDLRGDATFDATDDVTLEPDLPHDPDPTLAPSYEKPESTAREQQRAARIDRAYRLYEALQDESLPASTLMKKTGLSYPHVAMGLKAEASPQITPKI